MARTARLSVMLSDEIKKELKDMAASMGMTESALSSYIIGQWLHTQRQVNARVMSALSANDVAKVITSFATEGLKDMEGETK